MRSTRVGGTVETFRVRPADLAQLIKLVRDGLVSHAAAKEDLRDRCSRRESLRRRSRMMSRFSRSATTVRLIGWIDEVLAEHPEEAKRYLAGERKLQGVLVGFVMKKSAGKADPKRVNQLLMSRAGGG